jgi:hypothetical protein
MTLTDTRPAATVRTEAPGLSRRRRAAIWALVVTASLLGLVTILTTWVNRQMLDNQAWKNASAQVIQDAKVRTALSAYLVNQLYDNVDVAARLENRLPANLKGLAAPLSGALREPATSAADFLLGRPRVQQLFITTSGVAHQKLVNVLESKTGFGISTGNGVVTLDLRQLVRQLGGDLGLPADALAKLPADTGIITVMRSSQLSLAQTAVRAIRVLSVWLLVLVLGLYALAIYLARGIRRQTLRNVGWAFVLVGLIVLVIRRIAGNYAIDALTSPAYRGTVHDVWLIGSSILGEVGRATILYGLVTAAGAILAGPTAWAVAVRRGVAPTLNRRPGIAWSVAAFVFVLLVLWGPTHALRTWWGILLLGGLLAAGIEALRRQTLAEFPDAGSTPAPITRRLAGAARGPRNGNGSSPAEEIARLGRLRDAGLITGDEFDRGKRLALS